MSLEESVNIYKTALSKSNFDYIDSVPKDEAWVVLFEGKRIVMPGGKAVWRQKNHASCAVSAMLDQNLYHIPYQVRREVAFYQHQREARTLVRKKHFEVISLDEWRERGAP